MSTPMSIPTPMELAVAFANVVTVTSDNTNDWVARNGDESIFSVLQRLLPEVIQLNCRSRSPIMPPIRPILRS